MKTDKQEFGIRISQIDFVGLEFAQIYAIRIFVLFYPCSSVFIHG